MAPPGCVFTGTSNVSAVATPEMFLSDGGTAAVRTID
jgi:hypothetical protein